MYIYKLQTKRINVYYDGHMRRAKLLVTRDLPARRRMIGETGVGETEDIHKEQQERAFIVENTV